MGTHMRADPTTLQPSSKHHKQAAAGVDPTAVCAKTTWRMQGPLSASCVPKSGEVPDAFKINGVTPKCEDCGARPGIWQK